MALSSRAPSSFERQQRLMHLGLMRVMVPLVRIGGRQRVQHWLERSMNARSDTASCLFAPLPLVRVALGSLPEWSCRVDDFHTILAEWVDCNGRIRSCLDYFLGSGEWAPLIRSTHGDPVREEARQILAADFNYKTTDAYETLVSATVAGKPQRRQCRQLHTIADVDSYFERFVRLFRSVGTHGMLRHSDLDKSGVRFNNDRGMGIAIDADGQLHRLQGANHRWAIAQVLGLTEVPVEIRLIHIGSGMRLDELDGTALRPVLRSPVVRDVRGTDDDIPC